jgi:hypothetical protein
VVWYIIKFKCEVIGVWGGCMDIKVISELFVRELNTSTGQSVIDKFVSMVFCACQSSF